MLHVQLKLVQFGKHALVGLRVLFSLERLLALHLVTSVVSDAI